MAQAEAVALRRKGFRSTLERSGPQSILGGGAKDAIGSFSMSAGVARSPINDSTWDAGGGGGGGGAVILAGGRAATGGAAGAGVDGLR